MDHNHHQRKIKMNKIMLNISCYLINCYRILRAVIRNDFSVELFKLPVKLKDDK